MGSQRKSEVGSPRKSEVGSPRKSEVDSQRKTEGSIDDYLQGFPEPVREKLQRIRDLIHRLAPEAHEAIKYQIPTFVWHGNLVHFAAFERHIGFYPTPTAIEHFKKELSGFKSAKGSVQFPLDCDIPLDLIAAMVQFRVEEQTKKAAKKTQ